MTTITNILGTDNPKDSRSVINTNFSNLNTGKQETLVSGTNIKTINGNTLLGSGDLTLSGTGDVVGPASATANGIARYNSTTGKLIKNSTATVDDLGSIGSVNSVQLLASPTVASPIIGELYINTAENGLPEVKVSTNSSLTIGAEMYINATNKTGSTISDGQVVYINGAHGHRPTIALARADAIATCKVIGITTDSIANNATGFVTILGDVHSIDTSSFVAGDTLYLSAVTAGTLTSTAPTSPNFVIEVGKALNATVNGTIHCRPQGIIAANTALGTDGTVAPTQNAVKTYVDSGTSTMSNKSISLGSNTVTTTKAQLNTAVTDGDVVFLDSADTITGVKTFSTAPVLNALPTGTAVSNASTASTLVARDANGNISMNNWVNGFATTATAGATTTLTVASPMNQDFTGATTQTVVMPVTSTLQLGHGFWITNLSTGAVTVQSSGLNTILVVAPGTSALFTCILTSGTTASSWRTVYYSYIVASGKKVAINNSLTLAGTDATTITFQGTDTYVGRATTDTLTNKRVTKRTLTVTQSATPAMNTDNGDIFQITGLAQAITSMTTSLTGTPVDGDMIMIQITDNGTARAITWGTSFASTTVALPTTTVISTMLRVVLQWSSGTSKWNCVGVA